VPSAGVTFAQSAVGPRFEFHRVKWAVLAPHVRAGTGRGRPDRLPAPQHRGRDPLPRPDRLPVGRPAADFPHHKLVYQYFRTWTRDGTLTRMHNSLREQVRQQIEAPTRSRPRRWSTPSRYAAPRPSHAPAAGTRVCPRNSGTDDGGPCRALDHGGFALPSHPRGPHCIDQS
jgi:hypothetical protein